MPIKAEQAQTEFPASWLNIEMGNSALLKTHMKTSFQTTRSFCSVVILGVFLALRTCPANEVVSSWTGGSTGLFLGMTNQTFGYEFTVGNQPLNVSSLGIWIAPASGGLNYAHDVGLWRLTSPTTGTLLDSVTIGPGPALSLSPAGFWYEPISPLTLSPNTTYVLGAKYPFFALDIDWGTRSTTPTAGAGVTLGDARLGFGMTFEFPQAVNSFVNGGYYGPNMEYTIVPEPTACVMLGIGSATLAWKRRSRG
jgi:hypothetical protein